jgi:mRNA-degrading endonuclease RelE of RelBE toxin-antitoxin system
LSYAVIFLKEFLKQFCRLPGNVKGPGRKRVVELSEDPYLGIRLVGDLSAYWKDRVGKYRIIYQIDEANKTIIMNDVDLRKRVYD